MLINVSKLPSEGKDVIQIIGRFDFNERHNFKEAYSPFLEKSSESIIEINMAGVNYLDSSSLGMLMLLSEKAQLLGKSLLISHPNSLVSQIIDISNIAKISNIAIKL